MVNRFRLGEWEKKNEERRRIFKGPTLLLCIFFVNTSIGERTSGEGVFSESHVVGLLGLCNFELSPVGLPGLFSY